MIARLAARFVTEPAPRILWRFAHLAGWHGMRAVRRFERDRAKGVVFPPFLFVSVTDRCNLACQGCWVSGTNPPRDLAPEALDRLIGDCRRRGSRFFGILGGEPLLYAGLFDLFARHPDCYFLLFTNGTLFDDATAARLRRLGNVSPLISIEGDANVTRERRGGAGVYEGAMEALAACRRHRLIAGVATSVCKSNMDGMVNRSFLERMASAGALYAWYYIYRPVGPRPCPELALDAGEIRRLRRFLVDARLDAPLVVIDAYWDADGRALCPAAVGISHHVSPDGFIEPCPPIQFAADRVGDGQDVYDVIAGSRFLALFRELATRATRGCVLMEYPRLLAGFVRREGAHDTSGRNVGADELMSLRPCAGHDMAGAEIPERHWLYRFAKRRWFFGFGAYG